MPRWLARMLWKVRGKRAVRLHLETKDGGMTVEGILVGKMSGHYILLVPKVKNDETRTTALEGHLEVPAERVLFAQVMSAA